MFLEAVDGAVGLTVLDSIGRAVRATAFDQAGGPGLNEVLTDSFSTAIDHVFLLELRRLQPAVTRDYRFLVYHVNPAPESLAVRFTIGDSAGRERMENGADVDEFLASGQAGQEIAGLVYGLSLSGASGQLAMSVKHPVTGQQVGFTTGFAGGPTHAITTGRFTLPVTGDYRFSVRASSGARYVGAYAFRFHAIDRSPESTPSNIAMDTETREKIDEFGDIDEFSFPAAVGDEFNVFFQGSAPRQAQLEVLPPSGSPFTALPTTPADSGLYEHAIGRFRVAQAGAVTLRVSNQFDNLFADTGSYRLYVYAVNPLPEHVASAITPGDTVSGESIDLPGDIDEFSFTAATGDEFNVLFQPQVAVGAILSAEVIGPAGMVASVQGYGPAADLFHLVTGRFAAPAAGTYRIRVTGAGSTTPLHTGPYRLFLYRVDRHPESVPQTLALGDSVSSEAIDLPGDIDEFTFTVPDSGGANIQLQIDTAPETGEWVRATVFPATGDSLGYIELNTVDSPGGTGALTLAPGTYTIRVQATKWDDRPLIRTGYTLWAYGFHFTPEVATDTFAIGDTVSGEGLDVPGDVDRFHFYGTRGQLVNIALQGMSAASNGKFEMWLINPDPYGNPFLFLQSPTAAAALGDHQTTRLDLPFTGWHTIQIRGSALGSSREETGPYRFTVEPLDAAPEHVSASLVPGDSVTNESIDFLGDWDQFTITATPGDEIAVQFSAASSGGYSAAPVVFDAAPAEPLGEPFIVPASGHLSIAVREPAFYGRFCTDATCGDLFHFTGPYSFKIVRVNRAPENVPAPYVVGDTVSAESITPFDIDEFTGSGTPGSLLTIFYGMTATPVPPDGSIQLLIVDPENDFAFAGTGYAAVDTQFFNAGSFTVPASGNFIVRIQPYGNRVVTVPYRFVIKP